MSSMKCKWGPPAFVFIYTLIHQVAQQGKRLEFPACHRAVNKPLCEGYTSFVFIFLPAHKQEKKTSQINKNMFCRFYPLLLFLRRLGSSERVASTKFPSRTLSVTESTTGLSHKQTQKKIMLLKRKKQVIKKNNPQVAMLTCPARPSTQKQGGQLILQTLVNPE